MQNENLSLVEKFFRNKWVWVVGAVDLLLIIVIIVLLVNKSEETATIRFNVAPVDATITIDGFGGYKNIGQALDKNKNSGQSYSIKPGTHEIQISHADLDTKTFVIELEPDSNTDIITFLSKDNDFYFYTLRDNMSSFNRLASIASAEDNQTTDDDTSAEAFIARFQRDYELYNTQLPATYSEYDDKGKLTKYISVRASNNCDVTLCLKALIPSEDDKRLAESLLQGKGFNVEDFEIEYKIY